MTFRPRKLEVLRTSVFASLIIVLIIFCYNGYEWGVKTVYSTSILEGVASNAHQFTENGRVSMDGHSIKAVECVVVNQKRVFTDGLFLGSTGLVAIFCVVLIIYTKMSALNRLLAFTLWLTLGFLINRTDLGANITYPLQTVNLMLALMALILFYSRTYLHTEKTALNSIIQRAILVVVMFIGFKWEAFLILSTLVISFWYSFEAQKLVLIVRGYSGRVKYAVSLSVILLPIALVMSEQPQRVYQNASAVIQLLILFGVAAYVVRYLSRSFEANEKLAQENLALSQDLSGMQLLHSERERKRIVEEFEEDILSGVNEIQGSIQKDKNKDVQLEITNLLSIIRRYSYRLFPPYVNELSLKEVFERELESQNFSARVMMDVSHLNILEKPIGEGIKRVALQFFREFIESLHIGSKPSAFQIELNIAPKGPEFSLSLMMVLSMDERNLINPYSMSVNQLITILGPAVLGHKKYPNGWNIELLWNEPIIN